MERPTKDQSIPEQIDDLNLRPMKSGKGESMILVLRKNHVPIGYRIGGRQIAMNNVRSTVGLESVSSRQRPKRMVRPPRVQLLLQQVIEVERHNDRDVPLVRLFVLC
jgi:hypothetical protein